MSWPGGPSRPKPPPAGSKHPGRPRRLRASVNRAPGERRSDERTRFSFAKSDDAVGLLARDARAARPRNCVVKNTSQRGGLRSLLPGAEF
jgi:hypothetical protein